MRPSAAPSVQTAVAGRGTGPIVLAIALWLAIAVALGASGLPQRLRPPAPQLVILALTAALIAAGRWHAGFREWLLALDWRAIVALHITRAVAAGGFLLAAARGDLAARFAVPAADGDLAVAVLALVLVLAIPPDRADAPAAYALWNTFGLLDILLVVGNAARVGLDDPAGMAGLLRMPFVLLPLFLVPLIVASHVLLFVRVARRRHGREAGLGEGARPRPR
jgi:hypothetical protein